MCVSVCVYMCEHIYVCINAILLVTVYVVYFVCLQLMMKANTIYSKTKKNMDMAMKMEISVLDFNNRLLRYITLCSISARRLVFQLHHILQVQVLDLNLV